MNETLTMVNGRPVLRMERRLAHPPEKVWRAITEPSHLSQWYPFGVKEMDLRVGGKIMFDDGRGMTMGAVITELDPPRVFAFSEHAPAAMVRESDDLIRFELRPDVGGCLLIFTQVFDDRSAAASYASGWETCLTVMEMVLDGRPAEWPAGDMAQLHQSYVEAFGLAEGSAEQAGDGWRVRFERQLTKPIEEVWTRLGGPAATAGEPAPRGFSDGTAQGVIMVLQAPTLLEFADGAGDVGDAAGGSVGSSVDGSVGVGVGSSAGVGVGSVGRRVRWELSQGTGHGARLVLTHTGLADPGPSLTSWRARVEALARELLA